MNWQRPISEVSFVAFDLECTGPAPGFDRITEIGAARFTVRTDGSVEAGPTFEQLVRPSRSIPAHIATLTGITDAMVADAPPIEAVWPHLTDFLESNPDTVLLAHSARVDLSFLVLSATAHHEGWTPPPTLCTVAVARRAFRHAGRYGLMALVEHLDCGGHAPVHHRALADALHARNVFARCVAARHATCVADLDVKPVVVPTANELAVDVPPRLSALTAASNTQRPAWIVYRGGSKGRGRRMITPLGFYRRDEHVFLRAWCHLDQVAKSFRADRIGAVILKDQS